MGKKKIVICSDTLQHLTGLGKTALRIAKGFFDSGKYEISYFVITGQDSDSSCAPYYEKEYSCLFKNMNIYNCQLQDINKYKLFDDFILKEKPDIVFSLLDPWNLDQIETSQFREFFYWVAYCLFETPEYPEFAMVPSYIKHDAPRKSIFDPLRYADLCIPVTKMGGCVLDSKKVKHSDNVYLGINFDKRCTDSSLTKQSVFGTDVDDDDFIFMTVGRNSERKKLDKIIEMFAFFVKTRKEDENNRSYKLYVHTDFNEAVGGTDLIALASDLDVIDNVMFPVSFIKNETMSEKDLYKRYSVSDAYIEMSAGEGFGLPVLEALLHNKPIAYLNYGGHAEYCKDFGYAIRVGDCYEARNIHMRWALPHRADAVRALTEVSHTFDKKDSTQFVKDNFDWDSVIIPKLLTTIEDSFIQKRKNKFQFKENHINESSLYCTCCFSKFSL